MIRANLSREIPGLTFAAGFKAMMGMNRPLAARVEMRGDRPRLVINDRVVNPLFYGLTDCPGSRWSWEEVPSRNIQVFSGHGISLFQVDIWFEQLFDEKGKFDLSLVRRQIVGVKEISPEAGVMIRLHVNAPGWWCRRFPEECVGYADTEPKKEKDWGLSRPLAGDNGCPLRASFFSEKWKQWALDHLSVFCRELAETTEGNSVIGIQLSNGVYGEWHQFGFLEHDPDTGSAARNAFIEFLRSRYRTVSALSKAWGQTIIEWDKVGVPDSSERELIDEGILRDPSRNRWVIDYYQFLHNDTAELIIDLAKTVKKNWSRDIVAAVFYGYFHGMFGRLAAGGHLALEQILAAPEIDCLCGPQSYRKEARGMGGTGHSRGLLGPVVRAGKLWLDEMDEPTSYVGCSWDTSYESTIDDDVAVMRLNVLHPVIRGAGMWWYDFGPNALTPDAGNYGVSGTWDHPVLMKEVEKLAEIVADRVELDCARGADVLIVHDPSSFCYTVGRRLNFNCEELGDKEGNCGDPVSAHSIDSLTEGLLRSGLIHDEILLSELDSHDLSDYRLIFFATTPVLTAEQRKALKEKLSGFCGHIVLLSFFGWSDDRQMGASLAHELGGFGPEIVEMNRPVQRLELDGAVDEQDLVEKMQVVKITAPVTVVGRWEDGSLSAGFRKEETSVWWYFAIAPGNPALLRALGRRAGCHVVNKNDDTTLLGCGLLVVHSLPGGDRVLRLPGGKTFSVDLRPRSTTVIDVATGQILLD
ncbi:MAG: beta-galactosidase [Opitutaceae bacterium]|nr:beta-galactosidase [Opitutaceae bacterium]